MGGLLLLVALCVVMATVSFLAGVLPLSMTLTPSQMRLISSVGIGVLVGTSLIVIIPEGIESAAAAPAAEIALVHRTRSVLRRSPWAFGISLRDVDDSLAFIGSSSSSSREAPRIEVRQSVSGKRQEWEDDDGDLYDDKPGADPQPATDPQHDGAPHHPPSGIPGIPTFEIGFSMTLGFVLMFLIDRLPRHATESLRSTPETRHMSLDNLVGSSSSLSLSADEEADGFLGALAPSPRRARGLATTIGLVIHAAADGIAMGASAASSDLRLGLVVFLAIMLHKAPAAFGLTSVLLKQGLSKRAARGHLVIFSVAAPAGALTTWCLIALFGGEHLEGAAGQWWTGMLLLFSGGTFLYVAMHAMQEDGGTAAAQESLGMNGYGEGNAAGGRKAKGPRMRDTMATMAGILLPLVTQLGHEH